MGGQKPARTLRIRLHHLLGRFADPRIHHTFIFDQEPHFVELASEDRKAIQDYIAGRVKE